MRTMFTILCILFVIVMLCFIGGLNITFNPFSIKFTQLSYMLGWIFVTSGAFCFSLHGTKLVEEPKKNLIVLQTSNEAVIDRLNELGYLTDEFAPTKGGSMIVCENIFLVTDSALNVGEARDKYVVYDCGTDADMFLKMAEENLKNFTDDK